MPAAACPPQPLEVDVAKCAIHGRDNSTASTFFGSDYSCRAKLMQGPVRLDAPAEYPSEMTLTPGVQDLAPKTCQELKRLHPIRPRRGNYGPENDWPSFSCPGRISSGKPAAPAIELREVANSDGRH